MLSVWLKTFFYSFFEIGNLLPEQIMHTLKIGKFIQENVNSFK